MILLSNQGKTVPTEYPDWVLVLGGVLAALSVLPIPIVFFLRRFQCLRLDTDINKGVIRRNETTISTKQMMTDVDVSGPCGLFFLSLTVPSIRIVVACCTLMSHRRL